MSLSKTLENHIRNNLVELEGTPGRWTVPHPPIAGRHTISQEVFTRSGWRDLGVIDDPFKDQEDAMSAQIRQAKRDWYTSTFSSRRTRRRGSPPPIEVMMFTRWHDVNEETRYTVTKMAVALDKELNKGARIYTDPACPPDRMYFLNLENMYHQPTGEYRQKETTNMSNNIPDTTEQGDFVLVTVAVPTAKAANKGATLLMHEALMLIVAELPDVVELTLGMRYQYEDSAYIYEISQIGETELVLRRLTANSAGKRGSRLVEKRAKVEHDLRSGRATVVVEPASA